MTSALVAVASLVAAGCGSGTGGHSKANSSGATLTEAYSQQGPFAANYNPLVPTSALVSTNSVSYIYEPLLQYDLDKPDSPPAPWLATKYRWTDDNRELTFSLRRGVRWSEGGELTSRDVAFTLRLVESHAPLNPNGIDFSSVTTPSPYTVRIDFKQPSYSQLYYIATTPIVPAKLWARVKNPVNYSNPRPVGTGPFLLARGTPQYLYFNKNPHYWMPGLPKVAHLTMMQYESVPSIELALNSNHLDWGLFTPTNGFSKKFLGSEGSHHWRHVDSSLVALEPNLKVYPLNLVAFRKAMSDLLDRSRLSVVAGGNYPPATSPTGLILPKERSYLAPAYRNVRYTVNVGRARSLLQRAGFRLRHGTLYSPKGRPVRLTMVTATSFFDFIDDYELLKKEFGELGVSLALRTVSENAWASDVADGTFQLTIGGFVGGSGPGPYSLYQPIFDTKVSAPVGKPAAADQERWSVPTGDRLLNVLAGEHGAAASGALDQLENLMVQKLPVIPLFYFNENSFYSTKDFLGWPASGDVYGRMNVIVLHLRPRS